MKKLKGKVAIVTGGVGGIGIATAKRFLQEEAFVSLWDYKEEVGMEASQTLESYGSEAEFVRVDVRDIERVKHAAEHVFRKFERIDILINNAGITAGTVDALKVTQLQLNIIVDVNLKGAFNCMQAIAPYMQLNHYGRIVNTSSIVAAYGVAGQTIYAASKSGVLGLTRAWAQELGPRGITVNAVSPGYIDTPMNENNLQEFVSEVEMRTALGRIGKPEDVANAHLFLVSEEASFITGTVLPVDGGYIP